MFRKKVYTIPEYLHMREVEKNIQAMEREINSYKKDLKRYTKLVLLFASMISIAIQMNTGTGLVNMFNLKVLLQLLSNFQEVAKFTGIIFGQLLIIKNCIIDKDTKLMFSSMTYTLALYTVISIIVKIIETIITHFIY